MERVISEYRVHLTLREHAQALVGLVESARSALFASSAVRLASND
jgi:hypothetical protein